ncbi:hypothetical protein [Nostoc sp. 'Peltigera membranacea cyanobiont' 232]|uniref:hypothetical protein n=1 Tax=Nostoc sp. 'Peltigera membranacea cyanobiont' 232 TaxID=2014531 RepID=UPI0016736FC3|nr:hypothetical protein [Nostoc sp. 'Peltigera membranacea cyanobiont' 232]
MSNSMPVAYSKDLRGRGYRRDSSLDVVCQYLGLHEPTRSDENLNNTCNIFIAIPNGYRFPVDVVNI